MKTIPNKTSTAHRKLLESGSRPSGLITAPDHGDDLSIEEISYRASYVGPVLEEILHEMETHWEENHEIETWKDCDDAY